MFSFFISLFILVWELKVQKVNFRCFKYSSVVFLSLFSVCFKCKIRFRTYDIHALFPQFFWGRKAESANFFTFRMYVLTILVTLLLFKISPWQNLLHKKSFRTRYQVINTNDHQNTFLQVLKKAMDWAEWKFAKLCRLHWWVHRLQVLKQAMDRAKWKLCRLHRWIHHSATSRPSPNCTKLHHPPPT